MELGSAMQRAKEHEAKIKDAALRILEISEELHLTWADFEETLNEVKRQAILGTRNQG